MTRNEFMEKLAEALSPLPGSERSRVLEYYEEMISDRMEDGMSEADAVAAMGSIDQILEEAAPEIERASVEHTPPLPNAAAPLTFREPVQSIIANACSADLYIRRASLPDGATATVELNLSENLQCRCALNHGRLEIHVQNAGQRVFSLRNLFSLTHSSVTVTLADSALDCAELNASSGNIEVSDVIFTDRLSIGTASGDVTLNSVKTGSTCTVHTASGNVTAGNLLSGDEISVETASGDLRTRNLSSVVLSFSAASGDVTVQQAKCDYFEVNTASGDVRLAEVQCSSLSANCASGDVEITDCAASASLEANTASGNVRLNGASARSFDISTTSGDVRGSLTGPVGQYRFHAGSRTGDVRVPSAGGDCPVIIKTLSGDITITV